MMATHARKLTFEWDENKNRLNVEKHQIDFVIAVRIFERSHLVYDSPRSTEIRHVAVGEVNGKVIAVIYTVRHETIRIISARRARKKEEARYQALLSNQSSRTH